MFYEASSTHNTGTYMLISEITTALSRLIANKPIHSEFVKYGLTGSVIT